MSTFSKLKHGVASEMFQSNALQVRLEAISPGCHPHASHLLRRVYNDQYYAYSLGTCLQVL